MYTRSATSCPASHVACPGGKIHQSIGDFPHLQRRRASRSALHIRVDPYRTLESTFMLIRNSGVAIAAASYDDTPTQAGCDCSTC
jgi:hypothetical protein